MPRNAPVRAIWWISVVARRAPLQEGERKNAEGGNPEELSEAGIVILLVRPDPEPDDQVA
jgi:hypothetical protein